ncbi:hypothetical protein T4B_10998, partial [Trichinella pseudospiralis]
EHLEVESDDEVFIYTSDESDAGSCTEEAVTESELENQNGPRQQPAKEKNKFFLLFDENMIAQIHRHASRRMHILKKREFTFSEIYALLEIILRANTDKDNLPAVEHLYLQNGTRRPAVTPCGCCTSSLTCASTTHFTDESPTKLSEDKEAFYERAFSSADQATHQNEAQKSKNLCIN